MNEVLHEPLFPTAGAIAPDDGMELPSVADDACNSEIEWYNDIDEYYVVLDGLLGKYGTKVALTAQQEVGLAVAMELGVTAGHMLESAENKKMGEAGLLQGLAQEGEAAKKTMVLSNMGLVTDIAKRYAGNGSMTLGDLVHEGVFGLYQAIEKFDYRKGFKFSSHSVPWIEGAMTRAIADREKMIRKPVDVSQEIDRLGRLEAGLRQALGREPNLDEVAAIAYPKDMDAARKVTELRRHRQTPISLDMSVQEGKAYLGDLIIDNESDNPLDVLCRPDEASSPASARVQALRIAMSGLKERQVEVLRLRYGSGGVATLSAVATELGISAEAVRKNEKKAFAYLRSALEHMV